MVPARARLFAHAAVLEDEHEMGDVLLVETVRYLPGVQDDAPAAAPGRHPVGDLHDPALGMELLPVTGIDHHVSAGADHLPEPGERLDRGIARRRGPPSPVQAAINSAVATTRMITGSAGMVSSGAIRASLPDCAVPGGGAARWPGWPGDAAASAACSTSMTETPAQPGVVGRLAAADAEQPLSPHQVDDQQQVDRERPDLQPGDVPPWSGPRPPMAGRSRSPPWRSTRPSACPATARCSPPIR